MSQTSDLTRDFGFWLSRKSGYPLVSPDTLQISLTSRCNLRCKMCDVWENAEKTDELTLCEIKPVMDQCSQWGIKEVNLCGGEPLLRDVCFDIIKHAKDLGMRVILTTNGTLINENMAKRLIESKLDILTISVDGARAETHDKIRGQAGAFEKIISGIKHLNELGKSSDLVKVMILTLSNYNLDELEEYFALAKSLSIHSLYITPVVPNNVKLYERELRAGQDGLWISGERLKKLDEVLGKLDSHQKKQYGLNYPSFPLLRKYFRNEVAEKEWVCFSGYRRFVLLPEGSIQMCGHIIGNVRHTPSVKEIWHSKLAKQRRAEIKKCRHYCLQDCHARQESATLSNVFKKAFKGQK
ncbi:MAG: radical SAM protein [Candidatus Omnitrophota bacterium]